ncbi:MAG: crossover junction endodeoxyribonuclease RuvC [Ruminococcaceae bacterium]|nr:crossover junction endodeoxyribonuclease RuvC [Oscillospiraceae bacterium]
MVILGVDPGYAIVGFGVVSYNANRFSVIEYGAVTTDAGVRFTSRLEKIYDEFCEIISRTKPDALSIEKLFFNTNTTTAIDVAQARGVILLAATRHNIPVFEYTPLQVKSSVTGYGRAEKKQVMDMIKNILRLEKIPKPDDTADALALAVCHAHSSGSLYGKLNSGGRV